jgi:hypothetical protein
MVPELYEYFLGDILSVGSRAEAVARKRNDLLPVLFYRLSVFVLHMTL